MTDFVHADEQPPDNIEWHFADGIAVKQMLIAKAGTYIPQHSHKYDHISMLAAGRVRVYRDGKQSGDYDAPVGILIPAGVKHTFLSLVDNTVVYCIHNESRAGEIEILERHELVSP